MPRSLCTALLLAILCSVRGQGAVQDGRCYLMSGGAVESFFISEDTPVGAVIGILSVNGDPREGEGDIALSLQEKDAAVGIAPGTKNLTLLRGLDREEATGPSSVYVNVRCDRRRTNDPSFIIPVSIRVWDVNDNAPTWVGAPYHARLSELTSPGSRILHTLRATDADQPTHATIHYHVLEGPYSEYFEFANELDGELVLQKALDHESLPNFTVTLRATDQGAPPLHADTALYVRVLDADDLNPKFHHDSYGAIVSDDAEEGDELVISPSAVSAYDQDVSIDAPLYYAATGDNRQLVKIDRDTARVFVTRQLLAADLQYPLTVVLKVGPLDTTENRPSYFANVIPQATQYDNSDRYALATLSIDRRSRTSSGPVRFLQKSYSVTVPEDTPDGSVLITLTTNRMHDKKGLQFFVSDRSFLERFAINSAGELLLRRSLDYETRDRYDYQVMVTDGVHNDTATVNVTVVNVNDWEPRFRYPQYEFRVEPPADTAGLLAVGKVDVYDGDRGDYVALSVRGPDAGMFYMNDAGELYLRSEALSALDGSVISVTAVAEDSGVPPRQSSVPVLVHVPRAARRSAALLPVSVAVAASLAVLLLASLCLYVRKRGKGDAPNPPPTKRPSAAPTTSAERAPGGSLQSVSAGASTILADSSSSLDLRGAQPHKSHNRVAPQTLADHVGDAGGRSGVAWPANTIPARVKKLSWDDAGDTRRTEPDTAEITDATNPALADHMNLTVYF